MGDWLIWSNEHMMYWRRGPIGYTLNVDQAGRYSWAEATQICHKAQLGWKEDYPPEIPTPAPELEVAA